MLETGLLQISLRGLRSWRRLRRARRQFESWLNRGNVNTPAPSQDVKADVLVTHVQSAILDRADGLVFHQRELQGWQAIENDERFWDLNGGGIKEILRSDACPPVEDMDYYLRFQYFSRFDCYFIKGGVPVLQGGWPLLFEGRIGILKNSLRKPRPMKGAWGDRSFKCFLSIMSDVPFQLKPLLTVKIEYVTCDE